MKKLTCIFFTFIGTIVAAKSYAQDYSFKFNTVSPQFINETSNLVSYIDFGDVAIWGYMDITLSGGFHYQNTTGCYSKRYNIGRNAGIAPHSNSSEVLAAFGPVATQWKLGEMQINADKHLIIPIYLW